ncbi:MAG: S8 family serine peptidase, partial [Candidatus Lokiarchaeota archaeon]|nr:S8 family serine peptidase [Candidatus Lokiarchaeota archaeon]MBD3199651.1 S8 family serine peptidase [Candidatus Lokiarchaeota archaeon]
MVKKKHKKILIASIFCTIFISSLFININTIFNHKDFQNHKLKLKESSESYNPNLIVSFNSSSYPNGVEQKFEYYGGTIKKRWNSNVFNSFSGFSGFMPIEQNKTDFHLEFPNAVVESDEIIEAQMNYAAFQTGAINSSWNINGYKGDTNSSIAVLDTGVNPSNPYLKNKIIAWEDILNGGMITDVNGHGTFISSIITGTGITSYNSSEASDLVFIKNYTHSEIFGYDINPGNFSIKICTFNLSQSESYFYINSSWNEITEGIDNLWVDLYYEGNLLNSSKTTNGIWKTINHSISEDETGIYDVFIKYHKELNTDPKFKFNLNGNYFPESYVTNFPRYTGISNGTKLVNYKILNESAKGFMSDLITGLESVIENRTKHHIISTCISIATLGEDNNAILNAIDEVIENGIMVVIAAGNYGVKTSNSLNTIAENKNAIVVGAINDNDQVTFYSSMGKNIGDNVIKPDIVAPGGSQLAEHRSIVSADANSNKTTFMYGTSISAALVSGVLNLLVEAKWNNWNQWNMGDLKNKVNILKAMLLMTATETLSSREDNPNTDIDEGQAQYSPRRYLNLINLTDRAGLTDIHEGYGRLNVMTAIDALTKNLEPNISVNGHLASSSVNPLKAHAFARQVKLEKNHQYLFNLTNLESNTIFDIYLYSNSSNKWGEPILLASSRRTFNAFDYLYFTPKFNETNPILVIKAIQGESNFTLNISSVINNYDPELDIPEITYTGGEMNTTVLSLREIEGDTPANNISLDRYRFFIEYSDNDTANVPPQEVYLHIAELAKNFTMTQLTPQDINYTNGAVFATQYLELSNNTYHYYFIAKDGLKNARYPELNNLTIKIEFPENIKNIPIIQSFNNGFNNWTVQGPGWNLLKQLNINDNRSELYINEWRTIYFGTYHNYPLNYTYQPKLFDDPFPNGTLTSPFYDLTDADEFSELEARFGLRTSLNTNDEINLLVNINGSGWELEKTYTNIEKEWYVDTLNLTEYIESYLQFRFSTDLDEEADLINYKGFMIDFFAIENYSNNFDPQIGFNVNKDLKIKQDLEYQKITFSLNYSDKDNNYPEFVNIEIDGQNYSMTNQFGDWNSTNYLGGYKGIKFIRSISLVNFANTSFRFHVSDGDNINSTEWYNEDESLISYTFPIPSQSNIYQETIPIGYDFEDNISNFYIIGKPTPKENTAWLQGDNN